MKNAQLLFAFCICLFCSVIKAQLSESPRKKINFNREWKYAHGDVRGAERIGYNDSGWETVGVPHSFSIPYFMSKDFYVGYGWYRKSFMLPCQDDGAPAQSEEAAVERLFQGDCLEVHRYIIHQVMQSSQDGFLVGRSHALAVTDHISCHMEPVDHVFPVEGIDFAFNRSLGADSAGLFPGLLPLITQAAARILSKRLQGCHHHAQTYEFQIIIDCHLNRLLSARSIVKRNQII